jgi:hypothetical protein
MTSIDIGIRIDEPVTTLTDLLVAAVCFVAFFRLRRQARPGNTQLYFRFYFLLMAIATLCGGLIGHAFLYALSFSWKLPGWIVSMLSVALIERSSIEHTKSLISPRVSKFFLGMNIVELITIMTITLWTLDFRWVEFHSGYGLLGVVLPFHLYAWYRTHDRGSFVILIAVLVAGCAALVFMNKLSIHEWFNYLDISHTMMAIGAYVFYRGAKLLGQQSMNA